MKPPRRPAEGEPGGGTGGTQASGCLVPTSAASWDMPLPVLINERLGQSKGQAVAFAGATQLGLRLPCSVPVTDLLAHMGTQYMFLSMQEYTPWGHYTPRGGSETNLGISAITIAGGPGEPTERVAANSSLQRPACPPGALPTAHHGPAAAT